MVMVLCSMLKLTKGEFVIGPATLYTILKKIQEADYIILNGEDQDRRKTYYITEKGKEVIVREVERRIKMADHGKQALYNVRGFKE